MTNIEAVLEVMNPQDRWPTMDLQRNAAIRGIAVAIAGLADAVKELKCTPKN